MLLVTKRILKLFSRSLYFIFSGSIGVANDYEGQSVFTESEPIVLKKGACFGELALINNDTRNASIVCMETTEFLVIDRDDFEALNLFDRYNSEYLERIRYFQANPLLKNVSLEKIKTLASICKEELDKFLMEQKFCRKVTSYIKNFFMVYS